MKTKLSIDFLTCANTSLIEYLSVMVARHNAGECNIDLNVIDGFAKGWKAKYDWKQLSTYRPEGSPMLSIYWDEKPFIDVFEKEVYELQTTTEQDLLTTLS